MTLLSAGCGWLDLGPEVIQTSLVWAEMEVAPLCPPALGSGTAGQGPLTPSALWPPINSPLLFPGPGRGDSGLRGVDPGRQEQLHLCPA